MKRKLLLWVLGGIMVVAVWSMLAASVTLKWTATATNNVNDEEDADVLEVEERKKVVRQMWDAYTHTHSVRLPNFWCQAFQAAYDQLLSDVPALRDAAVSDIAKMSLQFLPHTR
ncbi:hypothetical protein VNO78_00420 [Psophocarpus tetragonolobus]|uniref:Uncharacterized protein n=1 Tax=Psophocarpus tetragonolobus TaxID=3891 RepID=A0AAN9SX35_PSOTE